jgi:hypothetical protein
MYGKFLVESPGIIVMKKLVISQWQVLNTRYTVIMYVQDLHHMQKYYLFGFIKSRIFQVGGCQICSPNNFVLNYSNRCTFDDQNYDKMWQTTFYTLFGVFTMRYLKET